ELENIFIQFLNTNNALVSAEKVGMLLPTIGDIDSRNYFKTNLQFYTKVFNKDKPDLDILVKKTININNMSYYNDIDLFNKFGVIVGYRNRQELMRNLIDLYDERKINCFFVPFDYLKCNFSDSVLKTIF